MQLTKGLGYGDLLCLNSLHHDFQVFRQFQRWSPKLDVFLFRRINPLTLSASDFQAFIFRNAPSTSIRIALIISMTHICSGGKSVNVVGMSRILT